jgi:hypothetical protein
MHPAIEAALELQQFLDEQGEKFCIIGGLAVQRWGEVRLTVDADATVLTDWSRDEFVTDLLLGSRFLPGLADASGVCAEKQGFASQERKGHPCGCRARGFGI